jgi:hypothetical protein
VRRELPAFAVVGLVYAAVHKARERRRSSTAGTSFCSDGCVNTRPANYGLFLAVTRPSESDGQQPLLTLGRRTHARQGPRPSVVRDALARRPLKLTAWIGVSTAQAARIDHREQTTPDDPASAAHSAPRLHVHKQAIRDTLGGVQDVRTECVAQPLDRARSCRLNKRPTDQEIRHGLQDSY